MKTSVLFLILITLTVAHVQAQRPRKTVSSSQQSAPQMQTNSSECLKAYDVNGYIIKVSNYCDAYVNYDLSFETEGKNQDGEVVSNDTTEMKDRNIDPLKKDSEVITVPQDPNKKIVYHFKNVQITRSVIKQN